MNKLLISKEEIENFSISSLKDFNGCPEALRYLTKVYGDKKDNLSLYQKDFYALINIGKSAWVFQFCFSILKKEYCFEFYKKHSRQLITKIEDFDLKQDLEFAVNSLGKDNLDYIKPTIQKIIDKHFNSISSEIDFYEERPFLQNEKKKAELNFLAHLIKSIQYLLENNERSFAQAAIELAAAQNSFNYPNYNSSEFKKDLAKELMEYTGLWHVQ